MGEVKQTPPEKLVFGFIYSAAPDYEKSKEMAISKYGPVDLESPELTFNYTSYYGDEMGSSLKRRFVSFEKLVDPSTLADIKIYSNEIERHFLLDGTDKRRINIDPGLLSLGKFILATTKNYSHRVYIGKGIWAEVTLHFKDKAFSTWPWTYPDYASKEYMDILMRIRELYKKQVGKL